MRIVRFAAIIILAALLIAATASKHTKPIGHAEMYWLVDRACSYGDEGDDLGLEMLLAAGADPSGPSDYKAFHHSRWQFGLEPTWHLVQAAYTDHPKIVKRLLEAGANPNLVCGEGETALTVAADHGNTEIVRLLLAAGADRNYKTPWGTAAEIAQRKGHAEIVSLLTEHK
jgi:Ankyrin repeats (3 copies)